MNALMYAVVPALPALPELTGVQQATVRDVTAGELRLLYSEHHSTQPLAMPQSALEFHHVLDTVLKQLDLVPFRFQTWMALDQLSSHLQQNAELYRGALDDVAGCVQMDVSISRANESAAGVAPSGREYLEQKAQREQDCRLAAAVIRENLDTYAQGWQQQPTRYGYRLFALVRRSELFRFQDHAARIQVSGAQVRVTGPWPASAFISIQPQIASRDVSKVDNVEPRIDLPQTGVAR